MPIKLQGCAASPIATAVQLQRAAVQAWKAWAACVAAMNGTRRHLWSCGGVQTPRAPPPPVAAMLSPILWQLNTPDRFDMYSVGVMLLQV